MASRCKGRARWRGEATYVLDDLAGVVDNGYRLFERHAGGVTWLSGEASNEKQKQKPTSS